MNGLFNALIGPSYLQQSRADWRTQTNACPCCGQLRNQILPQAHDEQFRSLYTALMNQQSAAWAMSNALRYEEKPPVELPWEDVQ